MKIAGILGGLGPQSTALFYEEIIRLSQAQEVVEYPQLLINSMSVWEFERNMDDLQALFHLVHKEVSRIQGEVDFIAMVCNSAHSVLEPLRSEVAIPVLAIQEEVVRVIRQDGLRKVGILGTKMTTGSRFYQKELAHVGIESLCLPVEESERFNRLIFEEMLKGESYELMREQLTKYANWLLQQGCEGVILGCTEFPLFLAQADFQAPIYASTQILAQSVFFRCLSD